MSDLADHTTLLGGTWISFRGFLVKGVHPERQRVSQVLLRDESRITQKGGTGGRVTRG